MGGRTAIIQLKFENSSHTMQFISSDHSIVTFEKYEDKVPTPDELTSYTGTYFSAELETAYTITLKDGKLAGYHSRFVEFDVQMLKKDIFSWAGMAVSKYVHDKNGKVLGFKITMSRLRNVWFEKKK
ncbi:MAG: hypothetical protein CFE24_13105 [Flavobacterium sp. BFFFF2]|nr:MAG: hypothetical protein CFE24_13105 [Flavobacterium sp. BFFFF2]